MPILVLCCSNLSTWKDGTASRRGRPKGAATEDGGRSPTFNAFYDGGETMNARLPIQVLASGLLLLAVSTSALHACPMKMCAS